MKNREHQNKEADNKVIEFDRTQSASGSSNRRNRRNQTTRSPVLRRLPMPPCLPSVPLACRPKKTN